MLVWVIEGRRVNESGVGWWVGGWSGVGGKSKRKGKERKGERWA